MRAETRYWYVCTRECRRAETHWPVSKGYRTSRDILTRHRNNTHIIISARRGGVGPPEAAVGARLEALPSPQLAALHARGCGRGRERQPTPAATTATAAENAGAAARASAPLGKSITHSVVDVLCGGRPARASVVRASVRARMRRWGLRRRCRWRKNCAVGQLITYTPVSGRIIYVHGVRVRVQNEIALCRAHTRPCHLDVRGG